MPNTYVTERICSNCKKTARINKDGVMHCIMYGVIKDIDKAKDCNSYREA